MLNKFFRGRMAVWLFVSLALAGIIAAIAPKLLPVSIYKLSLITSAAWVAYWIDRSLFPYARPDAFLPNLPVFSVGGPYCPGTAQVVAEGLTVMDEKLLQAFSMAQLRRAIIIAAAMIAVALGA